MYGSSSGPLIGGTGAGVLAYTGTGSLVLPMVVACIALAVGIALTLRKRHLARTAD